MPYPAVPQGSSAITAPMVTIAQYQAMTTDATSSDDDITAAILDAEQEVCEMCDRTIRYANYQELLFLYPSGMVYPSAAPLDVNKMILAGSLPIFNPPTDTDSTGAIVQGDGVWIGWFQPAYIPVWTGVVPPQTILNYWGGYQPYGASAGTTAALPKSLASILARVAYYALNPQVMTGIPGSAIKSLSVGGVSIAGDLQSFMQFDAQLRRDIRKWRKAEVVGWGT